MTLHEEDVTILPMLLETTQIFQAQVKRNKSRETKQSLHTSLLPTQTQQHPLIICPCPTFALTSCLSQARSGGVDLRITKDIDINACDQGLVVDPLRLHSLSRVDKVSCDRFKIAQVIRNFLSNAIKFTPRGGTVVVSACFIAGDSSLASASHTSGASSSKTVSAKPARTTALSRKSMSARQLVRCAVDSAAIGDLCKTHRPWRRCGVDKIFFVQHTASLSPCGCPSEQLYE